ncbi:putative transposase, fragment [Shigella sonnei]|nr:putative transposase, fragment [Shigella sonnei]
MNMMISYQELVRTFPNELAKSLKNPEDLSQFDWMLKMKPYSMLI